MPAKNETLDQFEDKLTELEELVRTLESGESRLEDAVKHFERGMKLSKSCEKLLQKAELRVSQLAAQADGSDALVPMDDITSTARDKSA
jgi:exodeoxyribonuclease VII small subunit